MNIGFIGLGKLGMPCAEEIAKKGHTVNGFDQEDVKSQHIRILDSIEQTVQGTDIVFVAVPTPHEQGYDGRHPSAHLEPKDFNYEIVKSVLTEANSYMDKDQLLVLISTVLPGTTRSTFVPLITNTRFVYNPYLIAMGSVGWDFLNPDIMMIGTEDGSVTGDAKELTDFYKTIVENDASIKIGTWDECECIKVFYNTFISTKLALVNMMQDVAQKQGNINVDVVTDALASCTKRIVSKQYMTAGMGDGGACHPRDNIALRYMAKNLDLQYDLFDAVMQSREVQAENMAKLLCAKAKEYELPVLIHGVSYKPGVEYLDGSYSLLVAHYCNKHNHNPILVDVITHNDPGPYKAVVLLAHNNKVTYDYTNNTQTDELYCELEQGSVIVDPWRSYPKDDSRYTVIHYGDTRYTMQITGHQ